MRRMLATCYLTLLRLTGIYGAFAVLAFFVAVPGMMARGQFAALPAVIAGVGMLVAVTLARPPLMPAWFARPSRRRHLLPVLLGTGLLPLLFVLPAMGAVIAMQIEEPLSRSLSVMAAAPPFLLLGLCFWMGLALCVWPDRTGGTPAPVPVSPRRPAMPVLRPEELADLRRQRGA